MIGVIATIRVQDGKTAEFEEAFRWLTAQVGENEPDCICYQLTKSRAEDRCYKVIELYASAQAAKAHSETDHMAAALAKIGPCLAGRPEIEQLDGIQ